MQNVPEIGGLAGVGIYIDDVNAIFLRRLLIEAALLSAVLIVITVWSYLIGRSISTPLSDLAGRIARLADGDLSIPAAGTEQATEVGAIARTKPLPAPLWAPSSRCQARWPRSSALRARSRPLWRNRWQQRRKSPTMSEVATTSSEVSQVAVQTKQKAAPVSNVSLQLSKAVKDFVSAITGDLGEAGGKF